MVTKRTGKPRGAPPIAWANDPDRYAIALVAALDAFEATSTRQASLLAAALMLGKYVVDIPLSVLHPGLVGGTYEKIFGSGESATTFDGRAAALRKKYRTAVRDPEAAQWIIVMAGIFMLLMNAKDWDRLKRESMNRASAIGEQAFIRDLVLRLQPPVS